MDDVRDRVLIEDPLDRGKVRDVAGDERQLLELAGLQDLGQPPRVRPEVEPDDRRPLADQLADRPRADAARARR